MQAGLQRRVSLQGELQQALEYLKAFSNEYLVIRALSPFLLSQVYHTSHKKSGLSLKWLPSFAISKNGDVFSSSNWQPQMSRLLFQHQS